MNEWVEGRAAEVDWTLVASRADLIAMVSAMREDLIARPGEWENGTLERFLEAFAAVVQDDRESGSMPEPGWSEVARFLVAASGYE